ncbi:MAG: DUF58 domain-containing protein [Bifidobacteriaceae bacterium]|nr:DUF58 domain-containing protein [Bifidobacteriaceae bacterium]
MGAAGLAQDLDGRPNGRPAAADASFHALRDYQPGDDRRAVHWRSTAWRGRLMVRQSEDTRRGRLALLVSAAGQEYASPNDFELAVSVYASLGAAQLAAGGELALVGQGAVLALARGGPGALLDHAAAAQLAPVGAAGQSLAQAVARWRAQAPGGAWAVMVTGGVLPETDLARLARRLPRAAAVLALRCRLGAAAEVGRRDRLGLATVGHLDQLAGALRRLGLR